ncbi:glycosyltransferase family 87 protein [Nocardia rhizosphaerihabitans]|uniref:Alpha-(1->3)-arabinofuranosyltransferase n=1 Tax=Nocardia rhizosphaerihabitans TaxID=1691570 RepID=A0ABQ2KCY2_9NOCA|nr:glycosyltransferase family 87 protein [Nocardia rhizosphaerihabitans]GGN79495.1 alpha-(1->3)-arabinofuranosyltransferase [Nocardia rhizosphaerihabitans]
MLRKLFDPGDLTASQVVKLVMWPLALVTAADMVFYKALPGHHTNDFKPVYTALDAFLHHAPVYTANLSSVDPHYLYPPGGTLLLAPMGLFDEATGRTVFLLLNLFAAILAVHLLLRMFGYTSRSPLAPVAYFALFLSEALVNTLTFGNVNGIFFLAEVGFLALLLQRRNVPAGIVLGLTIAIKPILAPLLLLPAVRRQWSTVTISLALPIAATAIAWPLAADPDRYFVHNLPYSLQVRDYYNSSISGFAAYYDVHPVATLLVRGLLAITVAISLWLLWRYYRHQELFFVTTATGVLLTGEFTLSSLGQQYYSMFLFPFLFTVVVKSSVLRNWPAWLAIFGFASYETWLLFRWPAFGRNLEYSRATFGWALLLIVVCCVLTDRYLAARREQRLAHGIDPAHLAPDFPTPDRRPIDIRPAVPPQPRSTQPKGSDQNPIPGQVVEAK